MHYALFTRQPISLDIDLIAELSAITGTPAKELAFVLLSGGQISQVLEKRAAQTLAHQLRLLGLDTELREVIHTAARPSENAMSKPEVVKETQTKVRLHPLVIALMALTACLFFFMLNQANQVAKPAEGLLAPAEPMQLEADKAHWLHDGYVFTPLAKYELKARVLSVKRYRFTRGAKLSPVDVALGWGFMSDTSILKDLKVSQRNRWYFVNWGANPPLDSTTIMNSSANTHLIPADKSIAKKIKALKEHHVVELKGYLVNISARDGFYWHSSTSRLDRGDGACELFWVEDIRIVRTKS